MTNEKQEFATFNEEAYLNYSMYVIRDRALPHVSDGLKPVQRRIVFAMHQLGLDNKSKYKKSARTIGDVLGKYHPHGDSACYEAMVLMAQDFSYKYPLIEGQGNWGSPDDPKSFAAMRYTESKLSKFSELLLEEINLGTVGFQPNFDGTLDEPKTLPSLVPNVLLNGASGIAVGMATDIPPHNINEIVSATKLLIKKPNSGLEDILECVNGPDYPTKSTIILTPDEIKNIYLTGRGSIKARAIYHIEKNDIVIDSLPHQTSGSKLIEQIANQMRSKKLPFVVDLQDESDHKTPTRIVISFKAKGPSPEAIMSHLFVTTDLQKSYRVNMNMIGLDGKPKVKPLIPLLEEWIIYRKETVINRTNYELNKINKNIHNLEGLIIAYLNLDEVIRIIREEDEPLKELMEAFGLTEIQANSILDTKLRQLAKLEENQIKSQLEKLKSKAEKLLKILNSTTILNNLLCKELDIALEKFGQERNCEIKSLPEAKAFSESEVIQKEDITVVISNKGYIKSGKGHNIDLSKTQFKGDDKIKITSEVRSNDTICLFGESGRIYNIKPHDLPSLKSNGDNLSKRINPAPLEVIFSAKPTSQNKSHMLIASDKGYGFISDTNNMETKAKAGKVLISVKPDETPLPPQFFNNNEGMICICTTSTGRLLSFNADEIPVLNKGKGNQFINIPKLNYSNGECMTFATIIPRNKGISIKHDKGSLDITKDALANFHGCRGRRGMKMPQEISNIYSIKPV